MKICINIIDRTAGKLSFIHSFIRSFTHPFIKEVNEPQPQKCLPLLLPLCEDGWWSETSGGEDETDGGKRKGQKTRRWQSHQRRVDMRDTHSRRRRWMAEQKERVNKTCYRSGRGEEVCLLHLNSLPVCKNNVFIRSASKRWSCVCVCT